MRTALFAAALVAVDDPPVPARPAPSTVTLLPMTTGLATSTVGLTANAALLLLA